MPRGHLPRVEFLSDRVRRAVGSALEGHSLTARSEAQVGQVAEMLQRCGLASASTFFTGRPWIMLRTASSVILPESVRGMSGTAMILAGTWRAVVLLRMVLRICF